MTLADPLPPVWNFLKLIFFKPSLTKHKIKMRVRLSSSLNAKKSLLSKRSIMQYEIPGLHCSRTTCIKL